MTIKEVEQELQIPRATIRFYEKEGLLNPKREENGYRDYSEEDIERLKKIIILRKLGITVTDITDVLDGASGLSDVLTANMEALEKQMEELRGAMRVCRNMLDSHVELADFDTERYWNTIEEEEKQGHRFMDIAKDIVETEKKIFTSWFAWTDTNGEIYDSVPVLIRDVLIASTFSGCICCLMRGSWSVKNFLGGIVGIAIIILVECVLSIPLYFLGKKYYWIAKNRRKVLFIVCLVLCGVLLVLNMVLFPDFYTAYPFF